MKNLPQQLLFEENSQKKERIDAEKVHRPVFHESHAPPLLSMKGKWKLLNSRRKKR